MFSGPSALSEVDGRIEPVRTTGLSVFTTRLRKYAVSSIVSVPWVIATPSTSDWAASLIHFGRELDPQLVVHVLAADRGHLDAAHVGELLHLRHGVDEHVHGDGAGLVSRGRRGLRRPGNGAASRDDDNPGFRLRASRLHPGHHARRTATPQTNELCTCIFLPPSER